MLSFRGLSCSSHFPSILSISPQPFKPLQSRTPATTIARTNAKFTEIQNGQRAAFEGEYTEAVSKQVSGIFIQINDVDLLIRQT